MSMYLHAFPYICNFIVLNLYVLPEDIKYKKERNWGLALSLSLSVCLSVGLCLSVCLTISVSVSLS